MYQTIKLGEIRTFPTVELLLESKDSLQDIDKLSFSGPDGKRIRMVHQGIGLFTVTMWSDVTNTYEVFPYDY